MDFSDLDNLLVDLDNQIKIINGAVVVNSPTLAPATYAPEPVSRPPPLHPPPQIPVPPPEALKKVSPSPSSVENSPSPSYFTEPHSSSSISGSDDEKVEIRQKANNLSSPKESPKQNEQKRTLSKRGTLFKKEKDLSPSFSEDSGFPEGYLIVLPKGSKRFFILKDGLLLLHKSKGGKKKSEWNVDNSSIKSETDDPFNFSLLCDGVNLLLRAASEEERNKWVEALSKEKDRAKKRTVRANTGYDMDPEEFKKMQIAKYEQQQKEAEERAKKLKEESFVKSSPLPPPILAVPPLSQNRSTSPVQTPLSPSIVPTNFPPVPAQSTTNPPANRPPITPKIPTPLITGEFPKLNHVERPTQNSSLPPQQPFPPRPTGFKPPPPPKNTNPVNTPVIPTQKILRPINKMEPKNNNPPLQRTAPVNPNAVSKPPIPNPVDEEDVLPSYDEVVQTTKLVETAPLPPPISANIPPPITVNIPPPIDVLPPLDPSIVPPPIDVPPPVNEEPVFPKKTQSSPKPQNPVNVASSFPIKTQSNPKTQANPGSQFNVPSQQDNAEPSSSSISSSHPDDNNGFGDFKVAIKDTEEKIQKQNENLAKLNKFLLDLNAKKEVAASKEDFVTAADCKRKITQIEEAIPATEQKIKELNSVLEKLKTNQSRLKQVALKKKINELNKKKLEAVNNEDFEVAAALKVEIAELEKQLEPEN